MRMSGQDKGDFAVCFIDLFALSTLAIKVNKLYDHIKYNPILYTEYAQKETSKSWLEDTEKMIQQIEKDSNFSENKLLELINELFPNMKKNGKTNDDRRVSSYENLMIAISYQTPASIMSISRTNKFIDLENKDEQANYLKGINNSYKIDKLIQFLLEDKNINKINGKEFCVLSSIYDRFLMSKQELKTFSFGLLGRVTLDAKLYELTIGLLESSKSQKELIKSILSNENYLPISSYLLYEKENIISLADEQKDKLLDDIKKALINKKFSFYENYELYFYKNLNKTESHRLEFLKDEDIIRIADILIGFKHMGMNEYKIIINKDELPKPYINDIKNKATKALSENISNIPIDIQAVLKSIIDSKCYSLKDAKETSYL